MKTLRLLLLGAALMCCGLICIGCDDDDQGTLPFAGNAWLIVPGGFSTNSVSGGSGSTP
jgi:hypothetical protein